MRDLMDPVDPKHVARQDIVAVLGRRNESVRREIFEGLKAMGLAAEIRQLERNMMSVEDDLAGARMLPAEWTAWKETLDLYSRLSEAVTKSRLPR